jgi:putative component of membrane protein insertase Oxa1/YidC/SpoIIIJ protein YidD
LTKELKPSESHKILIKEIEETIEVSISLIHESEELILLKCTYYPKCCKHSIQILSKFQFHLKVWLKYYNTCIAREKP